MDINWWKLLCSVCNVQFPTVRLINFGFDGDGALHLLGVCTVCLVRVEVVHTLEEILEDIKQVEKELSEEDINQFVDELDDGIFPWEELDDD